MDFNDLKNKLLSTIGQAGDSAKEFAGKAADAAQDLAGTVADKAKAGGRIAKLSMEIATEKENMKKTFVEIGKLYYDTHRENPDGLFIQLCEEIAISEKNIAEKEAELAEHKASFSASDNDDTVEVEFEEVVAEGEAAAEDAVEAITDAVEEVKDELDQ